MDNLRDIRLETPDCNQQEPEDRIDWIRLQDRYERVFEQASILVPTAQRRLPKLRNCTVHLVDERKEMITLRRHSALFLHPNLRSLTISCASTDFVNNLPAPLRDVSLSRTTKLEHLHLEECDIHGPTLLKLLRLPQALKTLKISEGTRYDFGFFARQSRLHGNITPDSLVEAVARYCSASLTALSLSLGHFRHSHQSISHRGHYLNLTLFDRLKTLEVDLRTCDLIRLRGPCDHLTHRRLPSALENLRVFGIPLGPRARPQGPIRATEAAYFPIRDCFIKDKEKHGIPNLTNLMFSYEFYDSDERASLATSDEGDTVEQVQQVPLAQNRLISECNSKRTSYRKANVRLLIQMVTLPHGFIPPYLFPEESPSHHVLWDSHPDLADCTGVWDTFVPTVES
jgi:hypothetical protein